jgi:hypothetical protein
MEKSLLLYPLILTVLLSSACTTLEGLTSSEAKTLVEEGKTLVYEDSSGERSEVVFFNETEERSESISQMKHHLKRLM